MAFSCYIAKWFKYSTILGYIDTVFGVVYKYILKMYIVVIVSIRRARSALNVSVNRSALSRHSLIRQYVMRFIIKIAMH